MPAGSSTLSICSELRPAAEKSPLSLLYHRLITLRHSQLIPTTDRFIMLGFPTYGFSCGLGFSRFRAPTQFSRFRGWFYSRFWAATGLPWFRIFCATKFEFGIIWSLYSGVATVIDSLCCLVISSTAAGFCWITTATTGVFLHPKGL